MEEWSWSELYGSVDVAGEGIGKGEVSKMESRLLSSKKREHLEQKLTAQKLHYTKDTAPPPPQPTWADYLPVFLPSATLLSLWLSYCPLKTRPRFLDNIFRKVVIL